MPFQTSIIGEMLLPRIMNEKILLPTLNGIPNWKYMKQYMQNILNKEKNKLELLNSI